MCAEKVTYSYYDWSLKVSEVPFASVSVEKPLPCVWSRKRAPSVDETAEDEGEDQPVPYNKRPFIRKNLIQNWVLFL